MSKFRKKKKGMPAISTASLPDIVFMLLFFFMVTTVMRETELKIKKPQLPKATEVKKLERKSLVSYIYVGKVKGQGGDKIQLNDRIADVKDVKHFIFAERVNISGDEISFRTTFIKAYVESSVGTITDIKEELRNINALKINYSTLKGDVMDNVKKK